jgi:hypothetical protein
MAGLRKAISPQSTIVMNIPTNNNEGIGFFFTFFVPFFPSFMVSADKYCGA